MSPTDTYQEILFKAAAQFGSGEPQVTTLGEGLIHRTYKVEFPSGKPAVLQCINKKTFLQPENIIHNYRLIQNYFRDNSHFNIPHLLVTKQGKLFWIDEKDNFWRATEFVDNSYAPQLASNEDEVFQAAYCFAKFTQSLSGIEIDELNIIIPAFHDLLLRYNKFEESVKKASIQRLLRSTHVIAELRQRNSLVKFYSFINNDPRFPARVMHHDCKISNILFDATTKKVVCPVDLDTVMPGKFFSDIGDMIRTMACTVDENSTRWEDIDIRGSFYNAIVKGYMEGIGETFTPEEIKHIHHAGLLMSYMQCLRFVTDYLNNDIYYKTTYEEQNLNRALNQLILLEKLENFLIEHLRYNAYVPLEEK